MKKFCLISLLVILLDRITKILVVKLLYGRVFDIINGFFYLTFVKNEGAAFSILTGKNIILVLFGLAAAIFLFLYMKKYGKKNIGYGMVMGGIIGNLIDRLFIGYVIDFIGFIIFGYYFPIFNIADIAIVIGAIFLIFEKNDK